MAKRIVVRELEPLELVFKDKVLTFMINNDALMLMTEMYGDINELLKKEKDSPYDFASKLLFCGVKIHHSDFEYEMAQSIILSGGLSLVVEIIENFMGNFLSNATDEQKERYLGEIQRLLKAYS
mgnify:CR=1 FL=1